MMKKLLLALCLTISTFSYAQNHAGWFFKSDNQCPYCDVRISYSSTVCWNCHRDLSEFREYKMKEKVAALSITLAKEKEKNDVLANERAKKNKLYSDSVLSSSDAINTLVNHYDTSISEIEELLPSYFDTYDVNVLNHVRQLFNNVNGHFISSIQKASYEIEECDAESLNRLLRLIDRTNSLRGKIESAMAYVPNEFMWGNITVKKNGSSYRLVLPESFSAPNLIVPATLKFNYAEVSISGLADNINLSRYTNLESIEYQGKLSVFDAAQHNNCSSLKSIIFSGSPTTPPRMINGKALREDINVYVPQDDIRVFGSKEGWDVSNLISTGDAHDLYAKKGVLYDIDKRSSQVSIQQYLKNDSSTPVILSIINGIPVTIVGSNAFAKSSFKTIVIPPMVTEIGNNAFTDCAALEKIVIPKIVHNIGSNAFRGCPKLKDIVIEGNNPPSASSNFVPSGCWLTVGEGLLDMFINTFPYGRCKKVREAGTGQYRAYDGSMIYLVSESDNTAKLIKGINTETLVLTDMVLDNLFKLTGIGPRSFDGCSKLTSLTIPSSLTSIDAEGFFGASNLTSVYSLGDVPPACDKAIFEKKNSCYVYVPSNAVKAYKKQKGWRSSHKIVGSDVTSTSETVSNESTKTKQWVDARDIDNSTSFSKIAWNSNWRCSQYDCWFSESPGLVTDNLSWASGTGSSSGRFTFHRFNRTQYTCNFSDKYKGCDADCYGARVAYGKAMRDAERSTLKKTEINGVFYYVLDLTEWENWKPLYLPYSKTKILNLFTSGQLLVFTK